MSMRILIADDHAVVRRGLRQLLQEDLPNAEFGEAQDGVGVLKLVAQADWDLVILDINMPGRSGIDVLRDMRERAPDLPVLVLSVHPEGQYAVRVLRLGAAGYLGKNAPPEELLQAVQRALAGRKYITDTLAEKLAYRLEDGEAEHLHDRLSDREFQVLCMIARGNAVGEIADELHLSVKTVSTYRTRLLEKMGMSNNAELIRYALEHNLV